MGISAFYYDAAAALVIDGRIGAAAQEERFSRKKHDVLLPIQAVHYCLREAGMEIQDLLLIEFYDKPMLKFERILGTDLSSAPFGFGSFVRAIPLWLHARLHLDGDDEQATLKSVQKALCICAASRIPLDK